jgi:hypothetical protein
MRASHRAPLAVAGLLTLLLLAALVPTAPARLCVAGCHLRRAYPGRANPLRGSPAYLRLAPLTGATNPTAKLKAVQAATTRRLNRDGAFNRREWANRFAVVEVADRSHR